MLLRISIDRLNESELNPRKRFDQAALEELAASIRKSGQLTPALARPKYWRGNPNVVRPDFTAADTQFELATGHRRRRAALLAGLTELDVIVREMDDAEFMEILTVENLQREDVHPLEEAQGFADLMKHAGYDVARIADRTGRSHRYVYDRLGLLKLIPELQKLFLDDEITTAHGVILARLSAEDQKRVLKASGALFTFAHEHALPGEADLGLRDRRKAMSPREVQRWIDVHVRFDPADAIVPEIFPATASTIAQATEQAEKVIHITRDHFVQPEAKDGEQRTYGPNSWTRADGKHGSKVCDHSVIGVVVVGPGRGESFRVCIAKKKCLVHYKAEVKAAEQREKEKAAGVSDSPAAKQRDDRTSARDDEAQRKAQEARTRYEAAIPRIAEAVAAKVRKLPTGAKGVLGKLVIEKVWLDSSAEKIVGRGTTADDLVRCIAFSQLHEEIGYGFNDFKDSAKELGIDLKKLVDAEPTAAKAVTKNPAKRSAKKKARR